MIRVAYLIDTISCDTAGTQKQVLETIVRLDRGKFKPSLICLWESDWMRFHQLPCSCLILGYRGFFDFGLFSVIQRLIQYISDARIDIIQTVFEDSIFIGLLGARLGEHHPILLSSRRDMGLGYKNQPWYHKLYPISLRFVNRFFDGIIANSMKVSAYATRRERVSQNKIIVIYNGIDLPDRPTTEPELFRQYEADVWIGIAASLTPVKRHDVLLNAFARLRNDAGDRRLRLVILGDGPLRVSLESMARMLRIEDRVHFEGVVKNVPDYLLQLDIGVLCSDREGLSNAILEYMACGLPVVATRVGGNTELLEEQSGLLVPRGDKLALANALLVLCNNREQRRRMGACARSVVETRFSWNRCMSELQTYYRQKAIS